MKKVGIIIVNWNSIRLGYAEDLVNSLNKIDYPQDQYTIFVADNKSDDGSPEYIEENLKNSIVVRNEDNLGFAEANNRIADRCIEEGYEYIYLLNHDVEVDPGFLKHAVTAMEEDESVGCVQSLLLLHQEKNIINSVGNAIHYLGFGFSQGGYEPLKHYPKDEYDRSEIAYGSGAAILLRLSLIEKVGLFDTHFFMYHEDLDLGWKIQMTGHKNILAYDSIVYHKYEFSKSMKKFYFMERNRYIVLFENMKFGSLLLISPMMIAFELGTLLFSIFNGFWKQKILVYPYFFKASSWKRIMQHRKEKKKFRTVKDKVIFQTFSGSITNQHINNPILLYIANPISRLYFWLVKKVMWW